MIENQDFEVLIKHYDRENAFFYCDPPYYSSEYVYQCGFTWDDHLRLKNTLANSKGKWLVSCNDCKEIRELYDGYSIGYLPVDKDAAFGFFQLIAARYEFRPTILTTNQPFSKWPMCLATLSSQTQLLTVWFITAKLSKSPAIPTASKAEKSLMLLLTDSSLIIVHFK